LRKAKELLETTFLSVKEVIAAVGISDLSHFVRDYKERYGESHLKPGLRPMSPKLQASGVVLAILANK
jgi:hypothetical protein